MDLAPFYPPRPAESRKGDFGRVVVAGGSERYAGAIAFNALAALRAGVDMVHVVAPRRAADIVATYSPDLITVPCDAPHPEPDVVLALLAGADALVLGGGVERTPEAHDALRDILAACKLPTVADAEALHALVGHETLVQGKPVLLTPHGGEYETLTGEAWPGDLDARKQAAMRTASRFGCTIIVKGRHEVISDGDRLDVDAAGSPYLTKGGYGDLLAGAAAAHLARGQDPYDAARVAAYIVGFAGQLASTESGESTLASDTLARFVHVIPRTTGVNVRPG